jgi:hypothetical protein
MTGGLIALGVVAFYLFHTILLWRSGRKPAGQVMHGLFADRDCSEYPGFEQSARLTHFACTLGRHFSNRIVNSTH